MTLIHLKVSQETATTVHFKVSKQLFQVEYKIINQIP